MNVIVHSLLRDVILFAEVRPQHSIGPAALPAPLIVPAETAMPGTGIQPLLSPLLLGQVVRVGFDAFHRFDFRRVPPAAGMAWSGMT
jgi:hypothetical protein